MDRFASLQVALCLSFCAALTNCRSPIRTAAPAIQFTRIPPAGDGTPYVMNEISGRVAGARPGDRIVVYALSGVWWVQPMAQKPFATIALDSTWTCSTHPGAEYAALLVGPAYNPPLTVNTLPKTNDLVRALAVVKGTEATVLRPTLEFSGFQWEIRPSALGQTTPASLPARPNAWTDQKGWLHLRVSKQGNNWAGAEVKLLRSLGFGSYRFVVEDVSRLDPASIFSMFTWDELGPPREMDIEISRWGEPQDKNAQFIVQPYVVPANTVRFEAPGGSLTYWIDWEAGRASFKAFRGSNPSHAQIIAEHTFTSGVPSAGTEQVHMSVSAFANRRNPLSNEFEVVVERFEFLP